MGCVCDRCQPGVNSCLVGHLCENCAKKIKRAKNISSIKALFPLTESMIQYADNINLSHDVYHNFHIIEICDDILRYLRSLPA